MFKKIFTTLLLSFCISCNANDSIKRQKDIKYKMKDKTNKYQNDSSMSSYLLIRKLYFKNFDNRFKNKIKILKTLLRFKDHKRS